MEKIFWIIIAPIIIYFFIIKPLKQYLEQKQEEKIKIRVENIVNSMSEKERLDILNSDDFKKWYTEKILENQDNNDYDQRKLLYMYAHYDSDKFLNL